MFNKLEAISSFVDTLIFLTNSEFTETIASSGEINFISL